MGCVFLDFCHSMQASATKAPIAHEIRLRAEELPASRLAGLATDAYVALLDCLEWEEEHDSTPRAPLPDDLQASHDAWLLGPEEEHGIDPISYIFEGKTYRFEAWSSEGLYTLSIVDAEGNGSEWKDRTLQSLSEKLWTEEMKDITYKHDDLSYVVTVMKTETGDLTLLPPYDAEIIAEEDGTEETGPVATEAEPEPTAEETGDDSERGIEHLEPKINVIKRDLLPGEAWVAYGANENILMYHLKVVEVKDNKIYFTQYHPRAGGGLL
jgi:hypothetical protein